MVEAGRLESVPNHPSLYRLGGVIRQLSQEAGVDWPRSKPGSGLLDPRVLLRSLDLQGRRLPQLLLTPRVPDAEPDLHMKPVFDMPHTWVLRHHSKTCKRTGLRLLRPMRAMSMTKGMSCAGGRAVSARAGRGGGSGSCRSRGSCSAGHAAHGCCRPLRRGGAPS